MNSLAIDQRPSADAWTDSQYHDCAAADPETVAGIARELIRSLGAGGDSHAQDPRREDMRRSATRFLSRLSLQP